MNWEVVIGLETHAQLSTQSKIFSGASTAFGAPPNTQASVIDLALPGVLPVLNEGAVERAIRFGLAVGAKIADQSIFARKNYFYPDLPKGYQISQYERPVVQGGTLSIAVAPKGGGPYAKTVRLTRAHLEEDAGKSLHEGAQLDRDQSGIDLNRAGTPLLEIVSEPDLRSSAEAVAYARALHSLVVWLGICDGNMQEGSFRCDANVSVRPVGSDTFGTRVEIKNLNSFRFLQQAIDHEVRRQIELLEDGGRVVQETRLYDPDRDETRSMRSGSKALAGYYEAVAAAVADRKAAANWVMGELSAALNSAGIGIESAPVSAVQLAGLINRVLDGTINQKTAKDVFAALWSREASSADAIIEARGLRQISDAGAIEKIIDEVLAAHPGPVAEFRAGKEKAFNSLVGQAMKATRGKANPQQLNDLLRRKLAG